MKAAETMIVWNPNIADGYNGDSTPPGAVAVGPIDLKDGEGDWGCSYSYSGGAAYFHRQKLSGKSQQLAVMMDWYMLVYSCGIDPYIAHLAFLEIDEYQAAIKEAGCAPAKGERGYTPGISHGRVIGPSLSKVQIERRGKVSHFWPAEEVSREMLSSRRKPRLLSGQSQP